MVGVVSGTGAGDARGLPRAGRQVPGAGGREGLVQRNHGLGRLDEGKVRRLPGAACVGGVSGWLLLDEGEW